LLTPSKRCLSDIRSFYNILVPHDGSPFCLKSIWRSKVPLRVTFFAWLATLVKILTLDNLRKRDVLVVNCRCMCKRSMEIVDHFLLHCEVASALWSVIFSCLGYKATRVVDLFTCWRELYGSPSSAAEWKVVLSCLL
jgi:hypothetical protein